MRHFILALAFASGWIFMLVGCDQVSQDKFDLPSAEIVAMDEAALPEDVQEQLSEIDQKLARIDSQLDQRLGAIERRLLNVELGGGPIAVRDGDHVVPTGDQPTAEHTAATGDQPTAERTAATGDQPTAERTDEERTVSADLAHASMNVEHEYVGPTICAPCHLPQYTSWQKTKMAHAFETLRPGKNAEAKRKANLDPNVDYTQVGACVGCHVTGYGKKGGFVDFSTTPDLAGVTCEVCHGPAGSYMSKGLKMNPQFKKADLVAEGFVDTVSVEQCKTCHNTNSPFVGEDYVFDFEANKEKGTHEHFPLRFKH